MPVYMLIDIQVLDGDTYSKYVTAVHSVVTAHGGRYVVRGGNPKPVGGGWNPERIIIIEFASQADLERCFSSPEYAALAPLREQSTTSRAVVLQAFTGPAAGNTDRCEGDSDS
jgi:uncharacterized protein (DUF1330 family)